MSASSPAGKPDKTMSSRLLTMKFMQRAAASSAAKGENSSEVEDSSHSPKRPRLSTQPSSPATPQSDRDAIAAAIAAEEEKRRQAIARQAAEAGETEWVLDIPSTFSAPARPMVVAAESLDAEDDAAWGGRRPFGNFKRKEPASQELGSGDNDAESEKPKAKPSKPSGKSFSKMTSISSGGGSGGGGGRNGSSTQDLLKKKKKRKSN